MQAPVPRPPQQTSAILMVSSAPEKKFACESAGIANKPPAKTPVCFTKSRREVLLLILWGFEKVIVQSDFYKRLQLLLSSVVSTAAQYENQQKPHLSTTTGFSEFVDRACSTPDPTTND